MPSSPPSVPPASPKSPKGVRGVVKKLKRRISHISILGHHSKPASLVSADHHDSALPSPPPEPLLIDVAPPHPISIPVYPKSRASTDSMASTGSTDGASIHPSIPEESSVSSMRSTDPSAMPSTYVSAQVDGDRTPSQEPRVDSLRPPTSDESAVASVPCDEDSSSRPEVQVESPLPDTPSSLPSSSADAEPSIHDDRREATLDPEFNASFDRVAEPQPSSAVAEPEVPDPFIVDDPDDPLSEDEEDSEQRPPGLSVDDHHQAAADEIALAQSTLSPSAATEPLPSPNLNKSIPPPPQPVSDDEDEEDTPDLYLPGLTIPTMFLPIPNTDPLTTLLTKYISPEKRPARDLTGEWHRTDVNTLVMTNSWRALARMARDRIVEADPEDLKVILELWHMRLASLARLRLFNQTSAECTNLFTVLNAIEPPAARQWLFERVLPFDLEVLHARLKYWAGDHMGYLDALAALLRRCKAKTRQPKLDAVGAALWRERGTRLCLILASQLVEMKDFTAAARLLEPLCTQPGGTTSPHVQSAVGRVYVQGGYLGMAARHFAAVDADAGAPPSLKSMNAAILASAEGDWPRAAQELRSLLAGDAENFVAVNNLAVALLNQGRIQEGIHVLEEALQTSPSSTVVAEPLLFNISTMYELRSTAGVDKKRDLLVEVAKWAGDGLRTTCLKMPTN
ncbi:hypothetical protein B0H21DRAFT_828887 [Amylocystis lapponica]|nr:hypothetical protein B0H21DRAFT_828887 [Amylocystis lapponica]